MWEDFEESVGVFARGGVFGAAGDRRLESIPSVHAGKVGTTSGGQTHGHVVGRVMVGGRCRGWGPGPKRKTQGRPM